MPKIVLNYYFRALSFCHESHKIDISHQPLMTMTSTKGMMNMNTTAFASELGTDARTARKFLRDITPKEDQPGKGSRWELPEGKRDLNKMRKQFADWTAAKEADKAEDATPEVEDEVTDEV